MKSKRQIRRVWGRLFSQTLKRREGFVIVDKRPFYIHNGYFGSPFDEDLLHISSLISKKDYFEYFKKFEGLIDDVSVSEIFVQFMKSDFLDNPQRFVI
jgi:hypothetical protein